MRVIITKEGQGLFSIETRRTRKSETKVRPERHVPRDQVSQALEKVIAGTRGEV